MAAKPHPLLQQCLITAYPAVSSQAGGTILVSTHVAHASLARLWDHSVNGQAIMPGAALLLAASSAAALASSAGAAVIAGAMITRPLLLSPTTQLQVSLSAANGRVEIGGGHSSLQEGMSHLKAQACTVLSTATDIAGHLEMPAGMRQIFGNIIPGDMSVEDQPRDAATTATVAVDESSQPDWQVPGRGMSPMALDATLHLGAVERAVLAGPSALLVPSGLQAFMPAARTSAHASDSGHMGAHALQMQPPQPSSKLSAHFFSSRSSPQGLLGVHGLLSRPLRPLAAFSQTMAALDSIQCKDVDAGAPDTDSGLRFGQYTVKWLAESPEVACKVSSQGTGLGLRVEQPPSSSTSGSAGHLLRALSFVQMAIAKRSSTLSAGLPHTGKAKVAAEIQFTTTGAFPSTLEIAPPTGQLHGNPVTRSSLLGRVMGSAEGAGLWSFFRAAALDVSPHSSPAPFASGTNRDILSSASFPCSSRLNSRSAAFLLASATSFTSAPSAAASVGNTFGVGTRNRVNSAAVLMPSSNTSSPAGDVDSCSSSCGGLVAVTGGMGALGALSAEWVGHGALGSDFQLLLMGRSGRSSQAGALGITGADGPGASITLAACDAAAAEDASCMLTQHTAGAPFESSHVCQL